jgi:hypothetical protein
MIRMSELRRRQQGRDQAAEQPAEVQKDGEARDGRDGMAEEEANAEGEKGGGGLVLGLLKVAAVLLVVPPMLNWAGLQRERAVLLNSTR